MRRQTRLAVDELPRRDGPWRRRMGATRQRCLIAGGIALLLLAAGAAAAAPPVPLPKPTLEALMKSMAATSGVEAHFHEVKDLSLLSAPIEVSGVLYFIPPDRLARITIHPSRSKLVIDGKRFSFQDEAGHESVDLSDNPVAREFVSNFIVLFNGDIHALRKRYRTEFRAEGRRWSLVLHPRGRPLADVVERVTLSGEGPELDRMELLETNGDRTTTTFQDVKVDHRFSSAERRRIFALPGSAAPSR